MAGLYHLAGKGTRKGWGVLAGLGKGLVIAGRRWEMLGGDFVLTRWLNHFYMHLV